MGVGFIDGMVVVVFGLVIGDQVYLFCVVLNFQCSDYNVQGCVLIDQVEWDFDFVVMQI